MTDDQARLEVEIKTKGCDVPADEWTRMEERLVEVREAVHGLGPARLRINAIRYPRSQDYHVEARLWLPGRSLSAGGRHEHLDSAYQACLRELLEEARAYQANPNRGAVEQAQGREALDRDVLAPEGGDAGPAAAAFQAGDYGRFRAALLGYEDWLRKRIGRWVQRYPEAQERLGDDLLIGDLLEEVYLSAFEAFDRHPKDVPLHTWLEGLIDPALQRALRHPDEVREEASLARTLREAPSG